MGIIYVVSASQAKQLRTAMRTFVREFGFLSFDRTPCGQSIPISEAHTLTILLSSETSGDAVTAKQLAERLCIDKSNVSRMCTRMEKSGMVTTENSRSDGRVKELKLSGKGRKLAQEIELASSKKFSELVKALPKGQTPAIVEALNQLSIAVRASSQG